MPCQNVGIVPLSTPLNSMRNRGNLVWYAFRLISSGYSVHREPRQAGGSWQKWTHICNLTAPFSCFRVPSGHIRDRRWSYTTGHWASKQSLACCDGCRDGSSGVCRASDDNVYSCAIMHEYSVGGMRRRRCSISDVWPVLGTSLLVEMRYVHEDGVLSRSRDDLHGNKEHILPCFHLPFRLANSGHRDRNLKSIAVRSSGNASGGLVLSKVGPSPPSSIQLSELGGFLVA